MELLITLSDAALSMLYNIYMNAGVIYTKPNRIVAPPYRIGYGKNVAFLRGNAITKKRWLSGLGCYYPIYYEGRTESLLSISEMFQISNKSLSEIWNEVVSEAHWVEWQGK